MSNFLTPLWDEIKAWFEGTAVPDAEKAAAAVEAVAKTWLSQFETDFGKAALAAAVTAVASFAVGGFPAVPAIAAAAAATLEAAGLATAENDAQTVLLNAARTALNAATASTSAAAPTAAVKESLTTEPAPAAA